MKKKILSLFLVAAMCVSVCCVSFVPASATTSKGYGNKVISVPDSRTIGIGEMVGLPVTVTNAKNESSVLVNYCSASGANGVLSGVNYDIEGNYRSLRVQIGKNNTGTANIWVTGKKTGKAPVYVAQNILTQQWATCNVTVKNAPTSVSLNKTSLTLGKGETFDLNSKLPSGTASYSVKYSSNNTKVATVKEAGGLVTANSEGTATITAKTYNGKTATCKVTVKKAPSKVTLSDTKVTLKVGQTYAIYEYTNSGSYANSFTWSSSNTGVATVAKGNGNIAKIKAVSKGTAKITIRTYNGKTATCKVTVK